MILDNVPENNYRTSFNPMALEKRLRKSPGWTISTNKEGNVTFDKNVQVREFSHTNDEM